MRNRAIDLCAMFTVSRTDELKRWELCDVFCFRIELICPMCLDNILRWFMLLIDVKDSCFNTLDFGDYSN